MAVEDLRSDPMMEHLLDSLESGKDIEHYGRLVFAMVARHFLSEDEVVEQLTKDPNFDEEQARALMAQVQQRDYNPPKRERIIEWMEKQNFPICPNPDDPDVCNVYKTLDFPEEIYKNIERYRLQKAQASNN